MNIAVISSEHFDRSDIFMDMMKQEDISMLISLPNMPIFPMMEEYSNENNIPLKWGDPIAKADKILFFWDGSNISMENGLQRAKKLGKKIKIIKYLML